MHRPRPMLSLTNHCTRRLRDLADRPARPATAPRIRPWPGQVIQHQEHPQRRTFQNARNSSRRRNAIGSGLRSRRPRRQPTRRSAAVRREARGSARDRLPVRQAKMFNVVTPSNKHPPVGRSRPGMAVPSRMWASARSRRAARDSRWRPCRAPTFWVYPGRRVPAFDTARPGRRWLMAAPAGGRTVGWTSGRSSHVRLGEDESELLDRTDECRGGGRRRGTKRTAG